MVLSIIGPRLYSKMCNDRLLPQLYRYMSKLSPTYGFNENVQEMMENKRKILPLAARHGKLP